MFKKLFQIDGPEQGAQIYFYDDDSFQYRRLHIEGSLLKLKDSNGISTACWGLWFSLRKYFNGYKDAAPGPVTLSYSRDIVLDPFGQLEDKEKPISKKEYLKNIAERKEYQLSETVKPRPLFDKFMIFLCGNIAVLAIFLGVKLVT